MGGAARQHGLAQSDCPPGLIGDQSAGKAAIWRSTHLLKSSATNDPSNLPFPSMGNRTSAAKTRHFDGTSRCLSSPTPMNRVHHRCEDRSCDQAGGEHEVSNDRRGSTPEVDFGHPNRRIGRIYICGRLLAVGQQEAKTETLVAVSESTSEGGRAAGRGAPKKLSRYRNSVRCKRVICTICLRGVSQEGSS